MKAGLFPYNYDTELKVAFVEVAHDVHTHSYQIPVDEAVEAGISPKVAERIVSPIPVLSIVKEMAFALIQLPDTSALSSAVGALEPGYFAEKLDSPYFVRSFLGSYFFVDHGKGADGTVKLSTRMILKTFEDSATGSAASVLSAFLGLGYFGDQREGEKEDFEVKFEIEQGVDMGRRSKILTNVVVDGVTGVVKKVFLGRSAVQVMEGILTI